MGRTTKHLAAIERVTKHLAADSVKIRVRSYQTFLRHEDLRKELNPKYVSNAINIGNCVAHEADALVGLPRKLSFLSGHQNKKKLTA